MRGILISLLILISAALSAEENPRHLPGDHARHFIVQTDHVLDAGEQARLSARGVEIQHVLPGHRYLVRAMDAQSIEAEPRVRAVPYAGSRKIASSAYREAARGAAFAHVNLVFHDDVSFEDAQNAVEAAGGEIDRPLSVDFDFPHRLSARIPSDALMRLANDERLFGVYGPPLHPVADNAVAAQVSHVTPLFSAPYNLSGQGVVVSLFELGPADTTHPEFGGRLTSHFSSGSTDQHATHVSGTIIASGINPAAKGMAPAATLHEFDATTDSAVFLNDKSKTLAPLGIVADNNSWGFQLGWQSIGSAPGGLVWFGAEDFFGGYDSFYSAPYDKIAHEGTVLFVHSAGNDGANGHPGLNTSFAQHGHADDNGNIISGQTFCYSQNGSGTDCPTPCSTGRAHCETTIHPTYGPFSTMGVYSSTKNAIAVGAVDSFGLIASFSSRGPTRDGRIKPDIVAKGTSQISTIPGGGYGPLNGTSMSSPVITGISALLTEQWRKSISGQSPSPQALKTLLMAGADDVGNTGPDYTYGFGLANAQTSVDLIRADGGTGSRIRIADVSQGLQIETSFTLTAAQNARIVLGWSDPEVLLPPATDTSDPMADKTLVNDLDLKVIDPSGATVMPYVLDPSHPENPATRGVNTIDNSEEIEIKNAAPGTYRVIVTGTSIGSGPTQRYVLVSNAALAIPCTDPYEPNDTAATAFGPLTSGQAITARTCASTDVDNFRIFVNAVGPLTVSVTTTDTPVRVTLSGNGITPVVTAIAAGATGSVTTQVSTPPANYIVKVEPTGTIGANASYTLTPTFNFVIPPRRRSTRH